MGYHFESDERNATGQFLSYHGDLNSKQREANLKLFREGKSQVCALVINGINTSDLFVIVLNMYGYCCKRVGYSIGTI